MIAAILGMLSIAAQAAQTPPAEVSPLTISSAFSRALEHNPETRAARERQNQIDAEFSTAKSQFFPTLSATALGSYRKDSLFSAAPLFGGEPYNFYSLGLQLNQPIYDGGATWAGLAGAKSARVLGETDLAIQERDVGLKVIQNFYALLLDQRRLDSLRHTQEVTAELLKIAESRRHIGRSQLLEVLQMKTRLALLLPRIAAAENQVKVDAFALAGILGEREASEIRIRGNLEPVDSKRLTEAVRELKSRVLELSRAETQIEQQEAVDRVAMARNYPQLGVVASWGRTSFAKTDILSGDATAWTLGLQLTVPIFSGLSSIHERRAQASRRAQLEIETVHVADQARLDQVRTGKDLELAESSVESSRQALQLAEDSLKEARKNYRLSTIDYRDLLTSQQNLFEAEGALDQARYDYIVGIAKYYVAWGYDIHGLISLLELK